MADMESQERRDLQIAGLELLLEDEASKALQCQNQLSVLQASCDRVCRAIGCRNLEQLEDLATGDRTTWKRVNIELNAKRMPILKGELKAAKEKVAGLEKESEAHAKQLESQTETIESLREQLSRTQAERDTAITDLIAARGASASVSKQCDEAFEEVRAVRSAYDNLKETHFAMQANLKEVRARRDAEHKRLSKAEKKGKSALFQVAMQIVLAYNKRNGVSGSDDNVKLEKTDSDSVLLSPARKGKDKETPTSGLHELESSPAPAPVIFGTSSVPNTPTKSRRTTALEAPANAHPKTVSAFKPGSSSRPVTATFPTGCPPGDASDALPSSYTLNGASTKAAPVRCSPRKLTPQKRKRPADENEDDDGKKDKTAPPSSPRSDISATQDETQAPVLRFTPTKRARRTADLPTSLPRPLNALQLSAENDPSKSTTPASHGPRLAPDSLPPPKAADALGDIFPRTRPATSPRRVAHAQRASLLSLGSPGNAKVNSKILRTYSKQMKRPVTREPDATFEEKRARKRGRYSAPEPSTSKLYQDDQSDTETEEEVDDDGAKKIFPYEEVVRGKRRKELDAEDCEECREYYKAVGPMPPRLQAPRWRSPTTSPQHQRHVHHHHHHRTEPASIALSSKRGHEKIGTTRPQGDEHYDPDFDDAFFAYQNDPQRGKEVDSHRQQISRHRAMFARPKTPPGYWDVDFPDTPRVNALNKQAYDMHMKKEGANKKR